MNTELEQDINRLLKVNGESIKAKDVIATVPEATLRAAMAFLIGKYCN